MGDIVSFSSTFKMAGYGGGSRLPAVPEILLTRRKNHVNAKKARVQAMIQAKKAKNTKNYNIFRRAENYIKQYRDVEREDIRLKRDAKKLSNIIVPGEVKLAIVIRIQGVNKIHPKVRKVLKLFRLLQINTAIFLKLNKATINMIRICEPFITWGYPNLKTVKNLMYKRGYAKIGGRPVPLNSNNLVEDNLGKSGMICIEDMVHEVFTVGPNFHKATSFLWPFKLNKPPGGWREKRTKFVEGGDLGNREEKINEILDKMI